MKFDIDWFSINALKKQQRKQDIYLFMHVRTILELIFTIKTTHCLLLDGGQAAGDALPELGR